ncbi:hypothetical protein SR882_10320 [Guyparkeria halophila]|uniref:Uncharacterized protein n=1 Tax=Guyparkeria halophila TaxID=47960 RepID=A0ABZ0YY92_9GAMM|nr:hypothetical protein [Guyparkeria halophila]WQH16145.1 hypothetical protein SR882_10320 [Guyparkeria halophila]
MPEYKRKTLQYRCVEGLHDGRTLQNLLTPVISGSHAYVDQRSQAVEGAHPDDELNRCLNRWVHEDNMLFGEFILYVPGTNKQVVTVQQRQRELSVDQIQPPQDPDGHPREFIDSVLYFGVKDNHLAIMQSQSLSDRDLERYLSWLLGSEGGNVLLDGEQIALRKELDIASRNIFNDVREVTVGAPLFDPTETQGTVDPETKQVNVNLTGRGLDWLRHALGRDWVDQLDQADLAGAHNVEVHLSIVRKGGKRTPGPDNAPQQTMSAITTTLRHLHEEDVTVHTRTYGTVKGDKLFLKTNKSIKCQYGVPTVDHVFEEMGAWLLECIEQDLVQ